MLREYNGWVDIDRDYAAHVIQHRMKKWCVFEPNPPKWGLTPVTEPLWALTPVGPDPLRVC